MTGVILIVASIKKAEINVSTADFRNALLLECHTMVSAHGMFKTIMFLLKNNMKHIYDYLM